MKEVDISITIHCKLMPKECPSTAQRIEIQQEEHRINYYLAHLAKIIEDKFKSGEKINMKFLSDKIGGGE